jgi:adenylate cyclase class IV
MARNVEVKLRLADRAAVEARAAALADHGPELILQDDTFFDARHGRLKLREFADGRGELIAYERADATGPKLSDYTIAPVAEPAALRTALTRALGAAGRVVKRRVLFLAGPTRIHLDAVDGLGDFLELEVVLRDDQPAEDGEAVARDLLSRLGLADAERIAGAYVDLLLDLTNAKDRPAP